jgi:hypothetical protein
MPNPIHPLEYASPHAEPRVAISRRWLGTVGDFVTVIVCWLAILLALPFVLLLVVLMIGLARMDR